MARHAAPSATQTEHPWRAAVRAGGASLLAGLTLAATASVILGPALEQILPGRGLGAWIVAAGGACGVLAFAFNRVANLPAFAALLTSIGLGPVSKAQAAAQRRQQT